MRKSLISILIGCVFGITTLAAIFAGVSLAAPGWLRSMFTAPVPTRAAQLPTPAPDQPPGTPAPEVTASPVTVPTADAGGFCPGPDNLTIALLGVDERSGDYGTPSRTDAIMLVNVRFDNQTAALFSIPRDLYVPQPNLARYGIEQDRINTAFLHGEVYGVEGGGPAEFKQTVEWNFGIRVHRYVLVNFGAFVQLVDALGGIEVDVPQAIYDPRFPREDGGTFVFQLPAGRQSMDGQTALRYARTRHQDDDYQRVRRQQHVMLGVAEKLISPAVIPQIPSLISNMQGLVRTDLAADELAALACVSPQIDRQAIETYAIDANLVIPWTTASGAQVSIPNRTALAPVVQSFLGQK